MLFSSRRPLEYDYFQITVASPTILRISASYTESDMDLAMRLYDSSQTLLMKWHFGNTGGPMGVGAGRRGSIFAIYYGSLNNNLYRWGDYIGGRITRAGGGVDNRELEKGTHLDYWTDDAVWTAVTQAP